MRLNRSHWIVLAGTLCVGAPFATTAADQAAGKALFQNMCASCHGADGNAVLPGAPNFAKGERMEKADDALKTTILNGKNAMPPFKGALSDEQVGDLLAHIRSLKK